MDTGARRHFTINRFYTIMSFNQTHTHTHTPVKLKKKKNLKNAAASPKELQSEASVGESVTLACILFVGPVMCAL